MIKSFYRETNVRNKITEKQYRNYIIVINNNLYL